MTGQQQVVSEVRAAGYSRTPRAAADVILQAVAKFRQEDQLLAQRYAVGRYGSGLGIPVDLAFK